MVTIPGRFREIIHDEPLPLSAEGAESLEVFAARELRLIVERAGNLLGAGIGWALVDLGLQRDEIPALLTPGALGEHPGFREVAAGTRPLGMGDPDAELVKIFQQAVQAVAARVPGAPEALRLQYWGADGGFGKETRQALEALRSWLGLGFSDAPAGELSADEARTLIRLLQEQPVPNLWADVPVGDIEEQPARRLVAIATGICESTAAVPYLRRVDGRTYRYTAAHFGVLAPEDGLLRAPGGVAYSLRKHSPGYWKCNIYGGAVVALAELPVPTFPVGRYRHFPRAERFGDRLARKAGWQLIHYCDHRDPADPTRAVTGAAQNDEIRALLAAAQPGDMFFVDHPGEPGEDGGHTRVCTAPAEAGDSDTAPLWAQAGKRAALQRRDGMNALADGQEIRFWLVRYRG